jgi:hypothetical protein
LLALFLAWSAEQVVLGASGTPPKVGDRAPDITGQPWINSQPLALAGLRGKVVLVEFWTYG